MYVCDVYQFSLKFNCQRFSNNVNLVFIDEELLTVYLFCGAYQCHFNIKEIYTFTKEYLLLWFPNLPSYQTFNYRLNWMNGAINELVKHLITFFKPTDCDSMTLLIDSMPIITCAGKNKTGKVATESGTKIYYSTKNMYYWGLKLHTLAFRRKGTIQFLEMIILSSEEKNDLTVSSREMADRLKSEYECLWSGV